RERPTVDQNDMYDPRENFRTLGLHAYVGPYAQIDLACTAYTAWSKAHTLVWHTCMGPRTRVVHSYGFTRS
ncbi:hypothetical protein J1N35_037483, partial [Gossypium stocksii]